VFSPIERWRPWVVVLGDAPVRPEDILAAPGDGPERGFWVRRRVGRRLSQRSANPLAGEEDGADSLQRADVHRRIARGQQQVGLFADFEAADFPPETDRLG
jgi:hypothetical protein